VRFFGLWGFSSLAGKIIVPQVLRNGKDDGKGIHIAFILTNIPSLPFSINEHPKTCILGFCVLQNVSFCWKKLTQLSFSLFPGNR
jgi:hypothetical protein